MQDRESSRPHYRDGALRTRLRLAAARSPGRLRETQRPSTKALGTDSSAAATTKCKSSHETRTSAIQTAPTAAAGVRLAIDLAQRFARRRSFTTARFDRFPARPSRT